MLSFSENETFDGKDRSLTYGCSALHLLNPNPQESAHAGSFFMPKIGVCIAIGLAWPMVINEEKILAAFQKYPERSFKLVEFTRIFDFGAHQRAEVRHTIRLLVQKGLVKALPKRRFILAGQKSGVFGVVRRHERGFGWFIADDDLCPDAFVPPRALKYLMSGDRVRAEVRKDKKGHIAEILEVVERRKEAIVGMLHSDHNVLFIEPSVDVFPDIVVLTNPIEKYEEALGQLVEARVIDPPSYNSSARAELTKVIGEEGALDVEINKVLIEHKIPERFPDEVLKACQVFGENPKESDCAGRRDLRDLPLVTIDGVTAKDFDDAVYAKREGSNFRVWVAIADVSHYVRAESPLDLEARERSTSLYYPGSVVPMLPEQLSNGLCSLNPDVDRLCMVAEMLVDPRGRFVETDFYPAVMKSFARLTYSDVQTWFEDSNAIELNICRERNRVFQGLNDLRKVASALRSMRGERGALDFELPENVFELNPYKEPVDVKVLIRADAHKMIEDLMIAANEAVAEHLESKGLPALFRVHELPDEDKLDKALSMLKRVMPGTAFKRDGLKAHPAKWLQQLLRKIPDDADYKDVINSLVLRAMMQARYANENLGHFGLASGAYLHFTSPIRRYPDLIVHRWLKRFLSESRSTSFWVEHLEQHFEELSTHTSDCERNATKVERIIKSLFGAWYMRDRVGQEYKGRIASVTDFGVFVQLENGLEGLVHISRLSQQRLNFDPDDVSLKTKSGHVVAALGMPIDVRVHEVNVPKRQIDLVPLHAAGTQDGGRSFYEQDSNDADVGPAAFKRRVRERREGRQNRNDGERSRDRHHRGDKEGQSRGRRGSPSGKSGSNSRNKRKGQSGRLGTAPTKSLSRRKRKTRK